MFRYEMHLHTNEGSACGRASGAEMAEFYHALGYDGMVVTDHFFNGNTAVDRSLPWEEMVERFMAGYESAKRRGDALGISVFFGFEASLMGTDFLVYGIGKEWLLAHPDCHKMRMSEFCDAVRADGGYVFQAHPFREADYIEMIRLLPRGVDGVEVLNACRTDFENERAREYAENYSLAPMCGTDNHVGARERIAALELSEKAESIQDIIEVIVNRSAQIKCYRLTGEAGQYRLEE